MRDPGHMGLKLRFKALGFEVGIEDLGCRVLGSCLGVRVVS